MKIILSGLIVALFSMTCFGGVTPNQEYQLNTQMGSAANAVQLGTLLSKNQNLVIGKYSYAVQGGSSIYNLKLLRNLKDPKSYVTIPSGAVITNVWIKTLTTELSSGGLYGAATVGISALASNDLLSGRGASTAFYTIFQGVPQLATSTTWVNMTSQKDVSIRIGGSDLTAGKFNAYITYVLGD